jgi:hypothetical protein
MHSPLPQQGRNGLRGDSFLYIQGHENIKMASGCIVDRPPSSLPSGGGKKLFGSVIPPSKKEHWGIKITWKGVEEEGVKGRGRKEDLCTEHGMACPLVRGAWNCGNTRSRPVV